MTEKLKKEEAAELAADVLEKAAGHPADFRPAGTAEETADKVDTDGIAELGAVHNSDGTKAADLYMLDLNEYPPGKIFTKPGGNPDDRRHNRVIVICPICDAPHMQTPPPELNFKPGDFVNPPITCDKCDAVIDKEATSRAAATIMKNLSPAAILDMLKNGGLKVATGGSQNAPTTATRQ